MLHSRKKNNIHTSEGEAQDNERSKHVTYQCDEPPGENNTYVGEGAPIPPKQI